MRSVVWTLSWLVCVGPMAAWAADAPQAIRQVEGIHEYRLANGLQVLLIPDASKPTTTVNVTYRVGSRMEGYGETGMAHLLEHLLFKSTTTHANVGAELSKRGMQFNGSTTPDRTNYFQTFPASAEQLQWVLQLEAERMTGAKVARSDLDTEMTVVRNELEAGENSPLRMLIQKTQAAAYQWHNYGKSTIGARSDVENVNIEHLQAFYKRHYQPDNATLIVAGSFDPAQVLKQAAEYFGRIPKPSRTLEPTWTVEPVQDGERQVTLRRTGGEKGLVAMYHIPPMASPDFPAFEVIAQALTITPNGRLHKRLVEAGLASYAFGWASRQAEPGLLNLGLGLKREDDLARAQSVFLDTIEGLGQNPITAEELQRSQVLWAGNLDQIMANPQRLCVTLSESIAAGDWRLLFWLRDRIQALTVDDVNRVARAWIKPANRTLGQFEATDAPDRSPMSAAANPQEVLKTFTPKAALAAGEAFDTSPANIDARTERYTLPSGLKVALLPKKSRGQTVQVAFKMQYGTEQNLRGRRLAADMVVGLLGAGTNGRNRAQISDAFAALKSRWGANGDPLWGAELSLSTQRGQLPDAMRLMTEVLRQPSFPRSEFDLLIRQQLQGIDQAAKDPGAMAQLALQRALSNYPQDDVRHVDSLDEQRQGLQALKLEDLVSAWRDFWGANHAELVIVGDFDPAQVKPLIAQLLGDWRAALPYVHIPQPSSDVAGQRLVTTLRDKPNAIAVGSLQLKITDRDADYPALHLATYVLGGGALESRLVTRLRQKDGLSYGAGAGFSASPVEPAGSISFWAQFAPQNRARLEAALREELDRLVQGGITADELATARKAMLAERSTARSSDTGLASSWAERLKLGRTYAESAQFEAQLAALTLDQVNAAIRKWVQPAKVNWSLAGDFADKP